MIEVNFLDASGVKILSLNTIQEIQIFFKINSHFLNAPTLIFELMSKHHRYILDGKEYYFHTSHIDNVGGMNTINYSLVQYN